MTIIILESTAAIQTTKPLPYPLSKYRDKQELAVADIRNQHTNDFETHKTEKKKKIIELPLMQFFFN